MQFDTPLHSRRDTTLTILIGICQGVFVLVQLNSLFGGLRFTSPKVNYQMFAAASLLSILAWIIRRRSFPRDRRDPLLRVAPLLGALGLVSLFGELYLLVLITGLFLVNTIPSILKPDQTFEWNGATVSVWHDLATDTSRRIVVQDVKIAGPLVWRRELADFDHAVVTITPLDSHRLRCIVLKPGPDPPDYRAVEREVILTVD